MRIKYNFFSFFTLLILLFHSVDTQAQVWNRPKGGGYAQVGFSDIVATAFYPGENMDDFELNRELTDRTLQFYGEYGLSDKITLNLVVPLKLLSTAEEVQANGTFSDNILPSGDLTSLGQIQMGVVYSLMKKNAWVLSTKGRLELNTSDFDNTTGLRSGPDAWGFSGAIQAGYGAKNFFASANTGFNLRTNSYSHQFFANLEGGAHYNSKVFFITTLEILQSLKNGSFDEENSLQYGLYASDQSFVAFQLKLGGYPIKDLGLWLSTGGAFDGSLVAKARALSFSISYQWE